MVSLLPVAKRRLDLLQNQAIPIQASLQTLVISNFLFIYCNVELEQEFIAIWNWPTCWLKAWINQWIPVLPLDSLFADSTEVAVIQTIFGSRQTIGMPQRSDFLTFLSPVEDAQHIACTQCGKPMPYLDHPASLSSKQDKHASQIHWSLFCWVATCIPRK